VLPWAPLCWVFCRPPVYRPAAVYLLAGDEVVATKAGQHPHGLERCLASLYGNPVPGLAVFTLSLGSPAPRRSFPSRVEPVVRSDAEKAARKAHADAQKPPPSGTRRPGRPQGSKNTPHADATRTPELWRLTGMLDGLRQRIAGGVPLTHCVLDGHFGNHNALQLAQQSHLHLMSNLRCAAALYCPDTGP
jgi:putative transposase